MTAAKKELVNLVREHFVPLFSEFGCSRVGRTGFEKQLGLVAGSVDFILSRDCRSFTPRLQILLPAFYKRGEMGVVVQRDLPSFLPSGDGSRWWRWSSREDAVAEILSLLRDSAMPWLDRLIRLDSLIQYLKARKYFDVDPAQAYAESVERLGQAGVTPSHVDASETPSVLPERRPDVIMNLSYCYEAAAEWERALTEWKEYSGIFRPADASQFKHRLEARLHYLTERGREARPPSR